jgi:uncharacterized membrane protein YsdA (DUF1294 family)
MTMPWQPSFWIAAAYAAVSLLTFLIYAIDKSAARAGRWRTPKATLHLLALAGGWPGALLAQQWLRHKSAKRSFRAVFWVTVVLNVVGLVLLCSMQEHTWATVLRGGFKYEVQRFRNGLGQE